MQINNFMTCRESKFNRLKNPKLLTCESHTSDVNVTEMKYKVLYPFLRHWLKISAGSISLVNCHFYADTLCRSFVSVMYQPDLFSWQRGTHFYWIWTGKSSRTLSDSGVTSNKGFFKNTAVCRSIPYCITKSSGYSFKCGGVLRHHVQLNLLIVSF